MKLSIRTKFTLAMIILFLIILVLTVFSGYYLNRMSKKTSAILKENYLSIVYAREMSEGIMNINQEIASCFVSNRNPDSLRIKKELSLIDKSLESEKNNITSPGEDKLVSVIETNYSEYRDNVIKSMNLQESADKFLYLQNKSSDLFKQLVLLSQMNGKSIEVKTDDAKIYAKKASVQMSIIGTLCFIIALSLTFNYGSYFNERFHQLHKGIKELASSNYGQRLYFDEGDEFSDIALVFNKMAEKLNENLQNKPIPIKEDSEKGIILHDVQELKEILSRMKIIEEQVSSLISKFKTE
jgi:ABC-type multidrug transport system fused ATPase/permease subunit